MCVFSAMAAVPDSAVVSLNGKVTDITAAPVAGAIVTVSNSQGVLTSTETNEYGAYSFPALKPGSYSVRVNSPGFAMYENRSVTVSARPRLLNVRLAGQLTVSTVELAKNPTR
jgi:protocatechuate 3,4-dioxygenase beta subunit